MRKKRTCTYTHIEYLCVCVRVIYYGQCIRVENFISTENCEWGHRPHSLNKCMFWHIKMLILRTACLFTHTYTRTLFHTSLCSVFHNIFSLTLAPAAFDLCAPKIACDLLTECVWLQHSKWEIEMNWI